MTDCIRKEDAKKWLTNLREDCGRYQDLWHYAEALDQIIELLSADVTPKWIPCKERLPEKDKLVLCQCRAGIIDVLRLKPNGFWENLNPYVNYMPGFVIAWMPLPEPYEGEREDDDGQR